jgi:osmoprotectant transport system permease protein
MGSLLIAAAQAPVSAQIAAAARPVVVASKPFAESYFLAELFAQLLEARDIAVDRRAGLGATEIAFGALRAGDIDVYPEYTGTGLLAILGETPAGGPRQVYGRVARVFRERWGIRWLAPLGFENTYAVAVRPATADSLGLRTLSDLARVAGGLVAGFSPDFIGRADGLVGLREAYGLRPGEVRPLLQAVKYRALAAGDVDVIDGYSTDGAIARYGMVVLDDDRAFFPPYEAAPLVSARLAGSRPDVLAVLGELAGRLDDAAMREWNRQVEVEGREVAAVASAALVELGLVEGEAVGAGSDRSGPGARGPSDQIGDGRRPPGFWRFFWARRVETLRLTGRHLVLVLVSMAAAVAVAVPLGLALERRRARAEGVIRGVGLLQTIPGIALLAFMIPLLGIGVTPAVAALFLYSIFPILRNTYTGVRDADPVAAEAARALGMTGAQVLRHVRLPLAAPVILAGVRTAAVINVGTATLAAFIGAGGLGDPIVAGLALSDTYLVLSGALPAAVLALAVDVGLQAVEDRLTPRGLEV